MRLSRFRRGLLDSSLLKCAFACVWPKNSLVLLLGLLLHVLLSATSLPASPPPKSSRAAAPENSSIFTIIIAKQNRAAELKAIHATWLRRMDRFHVFSDGAIRDPNVPQTRMPRVPSGWKTWLRTRWIVHFTKEHVADSSEWYLFVHDETFLMTEEVKLLLKAHSPDSKLYIVIGERVSGREKYGKAVLILNRASLKYFASTIHERKLAACKNSPETFELHACMRAGGFQRVDVDEDQQGRNRYLHVKRHLSPTEYTEHTRLGIYDDGKSSLCASPMSPLCPLLLLAPLLVSASGSPGRWIHVDRGNLTWEEMEVSPEGERFLLCRNFEQNHQGRFHWRFNGSSVLPERTQIHRGKLTFLRGSNAIRRKLVGRFDCCVRETIGNACYRTHLALGRATQSEGRNLASEHAASVQLLEGNAYFLRIFAVKRFETMACSLNGKFRLPPNVLFLNGRPPRKPMMPKADSSSLYYQMRIVDVGEENAGAYECKMTSRKNETRTKRFSVTVVEKSTTKANTPKSAESSAKWSFILLGVCFVLRTISF